MRSRNDFCEDASIYELGAIDGSQPRLLTITSPPDSLRVLANESLRFASSGIDPFFPWQKAHRLIAATLAQETGLLSGARSDRVAKYNQLLRIEEALGPEAVYRGRQELIVRRAEL